MSGFGPVPQPPNPLERELVHEEQDDIARAVHEEQDRALAREGHEAPRRWWLRFLRRDERRR